MLAGVTIPKPISMGGYEKNAKIFCGFLLGLFFILSFVLFYTATDIWFAKVFPLYLCLCSYICLTNISFFASKDHWSINK